MPENFYQENIFIPLAIFQKKEDCIKMKVGEQVLYLAQLKGLSKKEAKQKLSYWFEKLGAENWWNKKVEDLSKGMAQKIQFITTVLRS